MKKFTIINSTAIPLPIENIDTDQIIPSRFLKATTRKDFGKNLFIDWRFDTDGNIKKNFILNNKNYSGKILVTGKNFGCGSSREHAIWAIFDYGFRAVVSSFFADIFKDNALNNGLLPVEISEKFLTNIFKYLSKDPTIIIQINLINKKITVKKDQENFIINNYKQNCLINGYDDLDFLVNIKNEIECFEQKNIIIKK